MKYCDRYITKTQRIRNYFIYVASFIHSFLKIIYNPYADHKQTFVIGMTANCVMCLLANLSASNTNTTYFRRETNMIFVFCRLNRFTMLILYMHFAFKCKQYKNIQENKHVVTEVSGIGLELYTFMFTRTLQSIEIKK